MRRPRFIPSRQKLLERASQIANDAISGWRPGGICCFDFYHGTPTGVALHSELLCRAIGAIRSVESHRIGPGDRWPLVGHPDLVVWLAQARDLERAIDRKPWLHERAKRNMAYWSWELDPMPESEAASQEFVDEVWVVSGFVEQCLRGVVEKPVSVIPPPLLLAWDASLGKRSYSQPNHFVVVLDAYSSVARKNPWAAIAAFERVFGGRSEKSLTIRIVRDQGLDADSRRRLEAVKGPQIRVEFETFATGGEAREWMCGFDAYLSPHRSEGLGFNIAEAILLGLPVIATGYGGNVEFCDRTGVDLVGHRLVEGRDDQGLYPGNFQWAEPDFEQLCAALDAMAARSPDEQRQRADSARQGVVRFFDTQRILTKIEERLADRGIDD